MLILTRKPGQLFTIAPDTLLDPTTPVSVLFHSPIEILVTQVSGIQVKIGVQAHPSLTILRDELYRIGKK
ncbi:MAG TPA: carbon storage regulator [Acidiferrobacterales bacterium]|nr:carbon storage regulator [Acidiferrobacterales bacterium]